MPGLVANSFLLLGIENTRGTLAATLKTIPVMSPQVTPAQKWIKDKGLRGSPGEDYDNVQGPRNDAYDAKGYMFGDTFPILLRAALGQADTVTAAPTSTTLSSSASAGAATISTAASIAVGSAITVGAANSITQEGHITTAVSGAGPFTVTLDVPLQNAQGSGVAVTGFTAHQLGLANAAASASQPPSLSIQDFDAVTAYQLLAAQLTDLEFHWGAEIAAEWTAKFLANPFTSIGTPSAAPSTEVFVPGWASQLVINGTTSAVVAEGKITIKRNSSKSIFTGGAQGPYRNFAGPILVEGEAKFVVETGDATLTNGLTYLKYPWVLILTDPKSGHFVKFQLSRVQALDPKRERGQIYTEVSTKFEAELNTTDAVAGGYSPILCYAGNGQTTGYVGS